MKNKGITLVALVVTIVIMLILVGVTLNFALGDNGLFQRTRNAADKYEQAQKQEEKDLADIADKLEVTLAGGEATEVTDKNPGELSGKGTEEDPYLIESMEDLVEFSNKVNGGDTFEGKVVKLGENLDFQNNISYVDPTTKKYGEKELKTELTTGKGFTPIGNNTNKFNGTFNGAGHTIKNLYIKEETNNCVGLFGYVEAKGNIKNLVLSNVNITSTKNNVGALVGTNHGKIENIKIEGGSIEGNLYVGGVVGYSENEGNSVELCTNEGNVTGTRDIGGIVGLLEKGKITTGCNNGVIVGTGIFSPGDNYYHANVGGIVGEAKSSEIKNSHNHNIVKSTKGMDIGGIAGLAYNITMIEKCYNDGSIGVLEKKIDELNVGGIVGDFHTESVVSYCFNIGSVNGEMSIGGIVGLQGYISKAYINDCYNTGSINGIDGRIGGISYLTANTTGSEIKSCYNAGIINVTDKTNRLCSEVLQEKVLMKKIIQ